MAIIKTKQIFVKVFLGFSLVFLVSIVAITFFTRYNLEKHMMEEYESKGRSISESIADSSVYQLLHKDPSSIQSLLGQYLDISGVVYFVVRDYKFDIVAHTFVPGVPKALDEIQRREIKSGGLEFQKTLTLKLDRYGEVMEFISPMILGEIGYVHVGLSLKPIHNTISETVRQSQLLMLALFLLGSGILYYFILLISKPIQQLTDYSKALTNHHYSQPLAMQLDIKQMARDRHDEIRDLADSFVNLENQLIHYIQNLEQTMAAKEKMEGELKVAHDIQLTMLPKRNTLPDDLPVDIEGSLIPAKEVGGDFYDFFIKDQFLCFSVGDVSGKGVPAALFMSACMTMLKSNCLHLNSVSDIVTSVNTLLTQRNEHFLFVTVFFGILDMKTGEMTYVNAGHPPPLILGQDDQFTILPTTNGMAVGIEESYYYQSNTVQMQPNDCLLLFTDGIPEAENSEKELYSDPRLNELFQRIGKQECRSINKAILESVDEFVDGAIQSDDLTLLSVRWKGNDMSLKDKVKVHFKNDVSELVKLQRVVEMFSEENALAAKYTMNINLILEELITNTIFYGYEDHDDHLIYVTFQLEDGGLLIDIEDDGQAFNPLEQEEVDTSKSLDDTGIGGLGIHFVKSLVSSIAYSRENDKNFLKIKIKMEMEGESNEDIS